MKLTVRTSNVDYVRLIRIYFRRESIQTYNFRLQSILSNIRREILLEFASFFFSFIAIAFKTLSSINRRFDLIAMLTIYIQICC